MSNTNYSPRRTAILSGLLAAGVSAMLCAPAWGAVPAHPGMLNYVEGQASIDGRQVSSKSVGSVDVEQGQTIETGKGKAEILLTPGVFLRLGDDSALRMDTAGLTHTSVVLLRGEAMVEADDVHSQNNIQIVEKNAATTLDKNGIYKFNADQGQVAVYDGKATVSEGDQHVDLKKGKDTSLDRLHSQSFDRNQVDDLYRWSDLRSGYLSEASAGSARTYVVNNAGWAGGGWYWNPYYSFYSWLPGDGLFYSPFGYGFFSPWTVYGGYPIVNGRGFVRTGDRGGNFGRSSNRGFAAGSSSVARSNGFATGASHASSFGAAGTRGGRR